MNINKIVKEASTLLSGNIAAQAISLLAYLILTRIFSPDDFAIYNIFYSYIEVLIIFSTCKYELSVVASDTDREASAIAQFAIKCNTLFSLVLISLFAILLHIDSLPGNLRQLEWVVLLIPFLVYFTGTSRVYAALFNKFHQYSQIAISETVNAGAATAMKVFFGKIGWIFGGMPLGQTLGKMAGNLNYHLKLSRLNLPKTTWKEQKTAALKFKNFPLYVATKDFLNSFSANLPFLWAASHFDKAEIGLFSLALVVCLRPANLLNTAFEKVLYAQVVEKVRLQQSISKLILRFALIISIAALPFLALVFVYADPLFVFCFGDNWEGCGFYIRCLIPYVFITLTSTSLMFIPNVFSTQRTEFVFYIVLLLLRIAALWTGIKVSDFHVATMLYISAGIALTIALLTWYLFQIHRYEKKIRNIR